MTIRAKLTTFILAGMLAIAGSAPAFAKPDGKDIAKTIAGLAAIALVAKAIEDDKARKRDKEEQAKREDAKEKARIGRGEWIARPDKRREDRRWTSDGRRHWDNALPRACRVSVPTPYGDRPGYARYCLQDRYAFADRLPAACETLLRTPRGYRSVYGESCLERHGWHAHR